LQIIETGDSVKVKQVFDEAIVEAVKDCAYDINYNWENVKLFLMFISCVFAMVAQFFPIPFPASRPLLGLCCASYFILSIVLQYIISFIDKDTVVITLDKAVS
jgi:signal peptidase complex subunit 2